MHLLDGDAGLPALLVEDAEADLTTWVDAATKTDPLLTTRVRDCNATGAEKKLCRPSTT